jgi:RNA polymerase sigma factor (sigma-70 family)
MTANLSLEDLARRAIAGDREALDLVARELQADIYGLALRMLWNKEDAEDATQEILVRIVTRLAQFDFRSRLKTWAYRVAVNQILDVKKSAIEQLHLTFARFADDLTRGFEPESADDTDHSLLIDDVKVGCSLAMLQCLDRPHRLAYVLGEILELSGPEGAEVLEVSAALFRKRLQHAREAVLTFTKSHCGLVSNAAPCRCNRRVSRDAVTATTEVHPLQFGRRATSFTEARAMVRRVEEARWAMEVHRSSQPRASSVDFAQRLLQAIDPLRATGSQL